MKIRTNYVSNSSSSSFCIMGIVVDKDKYDSVDLSSGEDLTSWTGIDNYSETDLIIGASPHAMKDEETLIEFKNRIRKQLQLAGFTDVTVSDLDWHIDGGNDW